MLMFAVFSSLATIAYITTLQLAVVSTNGAGDVGVAVSRCVFVVFITQNDCCVIFQLMVKSSPSIIHTNN